MGYLLGRNYRRRDRDHLVLPRRMDAAVHRAEVCYLPLLGAALLRPATPPLQNYEPFATVAILPIGLPLRECHRRTISAKHDGGSPAALCDFHPNGGFLVMSRLLTVIGTFVALLAVSPALAEKSIVVSSTTSTQDSGLFGHILPLFKAKIAPRIVHRYTTTSEALP